MYVRYFPSFLSLLAVRLLLLCIGPLNLLDVSMVHSQADPNVLLVVLLPLGLHPGHVATFFRCSPVIHRREIYYNWEGV